MYNLYIFVYLLNLIFYSGLEGIKASAHRKSAGSRELRGGNRNQNSGKRPPKTFCSFILKINLKYFNWKFLLKNRFYLSNYKKCWRLTVRRQNCVWRKMQNSLPLGSVLETFEISAQNFPRLRSARRCYATLTHNGPKQSPSNL